MFRICALVAVIIFFSACSSSKDHSAKTAYAVSAPPPVTEPTTSSSSSSSNSSSSSSSSSSSGAPIAPLIPPVPENLEAEVNETQIVYRWTPVAGAAEYILYYSTQPDVTPTDTSIRWIRTRDPELVFDGFAGEDYYAVVTAVASNGIESGPSELLQTKLSDQPVMVLNFDDRPVGSTFEAEHVAENNNLLIQSGSVPSNHYLGATYVPTSIGSPRLRFVREFAPQRSYTLNYKVYFERGFDFGKGGKLPGLSPRYPATGCEERGPGSWSVRLMWLPEGGVSIYYYDQELVAGCGNTAKSMDFRFQRDRWYDIAIYVKLNSPTLTDGQISLYIDGIEVVKRTNLKLRAVGGVDTDIQKLLFSTFFGGSSPEWSPSTAVKSRFDQFEVYRGLRIRPPQ